jgi:prevent-host-death family protein
MGEEVVPISKFKATCLALLDKVKKTGKPILVTRRNEPIALITPPPKPKQPACWLGMFQDSGLLDTHTWVERFTVHGSGLKRPG